MSLAAAVLPLSVIVPPPAVRVSLSVTAPVITTPPPVPGLVLIASSTVIVPDVALIVTTPPLPPLPVVMPDVATVPTVISSKSVNEIDPLFRSTAIVLTSLPACSSVTVPTPVTCKFAAVRAPPP